MRRLALLVLLAAAAPAERLDLAAFARPCCREDAHRLATYFDYSHPPGLVRAGDGRHVWGLQWAEERDIFEVAVRFERPHRAEDVRLEYWAGQWPHPHPRMPSVEDPVDDPWQGEWLAARTRLKCEDRQCRFTFEPLAEDENRRAANLPRLPYRRTVKLRLVFPAEPPPIESVSVFSETTLRPVRLRVQVSGKPRFTAYNGFLDEVRAERGAYRIAGRVAEPGPAGSNDVTVIEVENGDRPFAFAPAEVPPGGMYLPDFDAVITLEGDPPAARQSVDGCARIRRRLAVEPEQSYERAAREIPPLDPVERQGGRLYLVLAPDSSWQKFAFEWGGNVFISKRGTKAMGRELERLSWPGDRLSWRIGTGNPPSFRSRAEDSSMSLLEDHLPVGLARWRDTAFDYEEEAFATLLEGPLAPEDPDRSEQTPAVLMLRLTARNCSTRAEMLDVRLEVEPAGAPAFDGRFLTDEGGRAVRALVRPPDRAAARLEQGGLRLSRLVAAGEAAIIDFALPFVPGLTEAERQRLAALDFLSERARLIDYWRRLIAGGMPFRVPEERFNVFAKGLLARIRISVTKDPRSGIPIVPAASYNYRMFANEAAFQAQLLDLAGRHAMARTYLEGLVALQGSKPFAGSYSGDQKAVYHGARIDEEYDYTAHDYNLDHGTVLWSLAEHYLLTRDRDWLRRVAPGMKRAADWIIEQRELTRVEVDGRPCPEYGLLPAGHLEDNRDWGHWFSVNAYAALGLSSLARSLADAGDADAIRYRREADLYRADLRRAVLRAAARAPVIRLRDNTWVPYVPTRVHQRIRLFGPLRAGLYARYPDKVQPTWRLSATRELLYGPLILIETGIFDAREPLAAWVLDDWEDNATMSEPLGLHVHGWVDEEFWFSRGGMVFQPNLQNPIRTYVRRGEARAAIRHLYNGFVSCYYPSVNLFNEEYRTWRSPSGPFYKTPDEAKFVHRLRDLLVTEYDGDLLLAAATPERWLAPGREIRVSGAPTHFGPVSYTLRGGEGEVRGTVELPQRHPWRDAWLVVRAPGGTPIAAVEINGRPWSDVDRARRRIRLPKSAGRLDIAVRLHRAR